MLVTFEGCFVVRFVIKLHIQGNENLIRDGPNEMLLDHFCFQAIFFVLDGLIQMPIFVTDQWKKKIEVLVLIWFDMGLRFG